MLFPSPFLSEQFYFIFLSESKGDVWCCLMLSSVLRTDTEEEAPRAKGPVEHHCGSVASCPSILSAGIAGVCHHVRLQGFLTRFKCHSFAIAKFTEISTDMQKRRSCEVRGKRFEMLTLKNTRMQPQAEQWPPGAGNARHIPYGGSSAQLTLALGFSDSKQPPELGEQPLHC